MNKEVLPRNWLIVDDHVEDAKLIAQSIPEGSKTVDIAHDLETAEYQLKHKIYDIVILDYYFKGTNKTGVDLIPVIRQLFPGLPLIMISSSDELSIVREAMKQGADFFVKKYPNPKLLRTTLALGAVQAQESRSRFIKKEKYSSYFLSQQVKADLQSTIRKRSEKVLISGGRGIGKTQTAKIFAASFVRSYYKDSPRSIIYVNCKDPKEAEEMIFGQPCSPFGAFERAQGGVLILDDIDFLPEYLAERLRNIFLNNVFVTSNGEELSLNQIKILSTMGVEMKPNLAGFIAAATDFEVELESIASLSEFAEKIAERLAMRNLSFSVKAIDHLKTAMQTVNWQMGYISLSQFVNGAICHALEQGKNKVYQADFPHLDRFEYGLNVEGNQQPLSGKDGEILLYTIRSGRNYYAAQKLLKKVMIKYSLELFEGNTSAAAESLGISRAAFSELGF